MGDYERNILLDVVTKLAMAAGLNIDPASMTNEHLIDFVIAFYD